MDSVVLEGVTPATAAKQLEDKKWHLGVFHGVELAWVQSKYPNLRPLMIAPDIDSPVKVAVVAEKKSNVNSFADLKGKQVMMLDRLHCRLFRDKLTGKEQNYFAGTQETRSVEQAVNAVLEGKAAGAIVDTPTLKFFQGLQPGRFAQLKIVQESEPFPPAVIVYRQGALSDALLKHLVDSMLKVNQSDQGRDVLKAFHCAGFQTVPADFQQSLTAIARALSESRIAECESVYHKG